MENKIVRFFIGLSILAGVTLQASQVSQSGRELFMQKCSMCHKTVRPKDMKSLVAPPISGVAAQVKMKYPLRKDAVAFISDYALNPQRSKSLCLPKRIKRFGLMPSQKGSVTKKQVVKIANYIYDNYPKKGFVPFLKINKNKMKKLLKIESQLPVNNKSMIKPFLIKRGLPHFVIIIQKNWNNPTLALSKKQKKRLNIVKKTTLAKLKKYIRIVNIMQKKIVTASLKGVKPRDLKNLVNKLAKEKKEATMIHLKCIYNTKKILTKKQYKYLLKIYQKSK